MLARGFDVPQVDVVINFDVPTVTICGWNEPDYANFMHRASLTGRFGSDGFALTLITKGDDNELGFVKKIAEAYSIDIKELKSFKEFEDIYRKMREERSS